MASQTGRTVGKYIKVQISDSGDTLRDIPVSTIGGVGIEYDEVELAALQDAVKGVLPGQGNVGIPITGPFDTTAAQAASSSAGAPALSGSHTVLEPLNGGTTPLSFAVYFGVRHDWETGEPVFGGENLFLVTNYIVNDDGTYSANIKLSAGASAPTWGTSAIS